MRTYLLWLNRQLIPLLVIQCAVLWLALIALFILTIGGAQ